MRSLRGRLGVLVAGGALVVTLGASTAIAIERWQEENNSLIRSVELAAFQLSETQTPATPTVSVAGGTDVFAVVFDHGIGVMGQSGDLSAELLDTLIADVWSETAEQDMAVTYEYDVAGTRLVVSGVACVDQVACDSVVVGVGEERFLEYLDGRWFWLIGPALLTALVGLVASRWLVGRSLRPVDEMRQELEAITATDLERRVQTPSTGDELERLGLTLNQTIARLGAAVTANERFVADAAHELRSPITGVRAALEVEASRSPGSMIEDSVRELDRAARLIDDLLVLAQRQGKTPRHGDVDLDDVVAHELTALRTRFPGIEIERRIEPVRMTGDIDALRRVVANLLENACRYGDGQVAITLRREGDRCHLRVDDNGPGIPAKSRKAVFSRFTRLDASRSRETGGSGLGLAIVHEIVTAHDGTITTTESHLGGAQFEVVLPIH